MRWCLAGDLPCRKRATNARRNRQYKILRDSPGHPSYIDTNTAMLIPKIASTLSLVTAAPYPSVLAAVQNITLVAGSSDNITFNGDGWHGQGDWQGLEPENESCSRTPGVYSWTVGSSVSVTFQGMAIYFVGWNHSGNTFYQPYLDGVPDSPVTGASSGCNIIQYRRTGLANTPHNLTMALLTDEPGYIGVETRKIGVSGIIVTTEDSGLPRSINTVSSRRTNAESGKRRLQANANVPTPPGVTSAVVGNNGSGSNKINTVFAPVTARALTGTSSLPIVGNIPALSATPSLPAECLALNNATFTDPNGIIIPTSSDSSRSLGTTGVIETTTSVSITSASLSSRSSIFGLPTATGSPTVTASNGSASTQMGAVSTTAILGTPGSTAGMTGSGSGTVLSKSGPISTSSSSTASAMSVLSKTAGSPAAVNNDPARVLSTSSHGSSPASPIATASSTAGSVLPTFTGAVPFSGKSIVSSMATSATQVTGPSATASSTAGSVLPTVTGAVPLSGESTVSSMATSATQVTGPSATASSAASSVLPTVTSAVPLSVESVVSSMATSSVTEVIPLSTSDGGGDPSSDANVIPGAPTTTIGPSSSVVQTRLNQTAVLSLPTQQGQVVQATPTDGGHSSTTSDDKDGSFALSTADPAPATSGDERPVLPTSNGSPVSTPIPDPTGDVLVSRKPSSHRAKVVGSIVGGILGFAAIIGFISFASWAHKISHAKKASKPGAFKSKTHEFNFVIPPYPYRPDHKSRRNSSNSFQITLTLTPVDIEEGYTYQQVAWQTFDVTQSAKSTTVTKRLDYDRGFGAANIQDGGDAIGGVAFSKSPQTFEHAKPGRPVPFKGHTWSNPLRFIARKYQRIIARNDDHVPLRLVIGSYVWDEKERYSSEYVDSRDGVEEGQAGFQSFVVMDDKIGYAEEISASFDLILRVYKTQGVHVEQILSPAYVKHKAVPLLGEGIRLSKLPMVATWVVDTEGPDVQLRMEGPGWAQYLSEYL